VALTPVHDTLYVRQNQRIETRRIWSDVVALYKRPGRIDVEQDLRLRIPGDQVAAAAAEGVADAVAVALHVDPEPHVRLRRRTGRVRPDERVQDRHLVRLDEDPIVRRVVDHQAVD